MIFAIKLISVSLIWIGCGYTSYRIMKRCLVKVYGADTAEAIIVLGISPSIVYHIILGPIGLISTIIVYVFGSNRAKREFEKWLTMKY